VRQLRSLATECVGALEWVVEALLDAKDCVAAEDAASALAAGSARCVRLFRALTHVGSPEAQSGLARYVRRAASLPVLLQQPLQISVRRPTAELLEALEARLTKAKSGGAEATQLLLTVASMGRRAKAYNVHHIQMSNLQPASLLSPVRLAYRLCPGSPVSQPDDRGPLQAVLAKVRRHVHDELRAVLSEDKAVWKALHANATAKEAALWRRLGPLDKESLFAHLGPFSRHGREARAQLRHAWARREQGTIEAHVRGSLRHHCRELLREASPRLGPYEEAMHLERLGTALLAAGNLASDDPRAIKLTTKLLDHRDEQVTYYAIGAHRAHADTPRSAPVRRALLRVQSRKGATLRQRRLALKELRSHMKHEAHADVAEVAVREKMRSEWLSDGQAACGRACAAQCAPDGLRPRCEKACHSKCKEQHLYLEELQQLVRTVPEKMRRALVEAHATEAHPSRRQLGATFVDLTLQHEPFRFDWASGGEFLGTLGGAKAEAAAVAENSAWLRLGLFGGGFGVDLFNEAKALAEARFLNFGGEQEFLFASLQFKMDKTYLNK